MTSRRTTRPAERAETARQAIRRALEGREATARELSAVVGAPEKEIVAHLDSLARSREVSLVVAPAACIGCGFRFAKRERAARPSRCPRCRGERITPPRFSLP